MMMTKKKYVLDDIKIGIRNKCDDKDYMFLSKNMTCEKIQILLNDNKNIICDMYDKDGLIGFPILDINNNIDSDECEIIMRDMKILLKDRFLYNIIYNINNNRYSLQEQNEYSEEVFVGK
jgi:hypothetical protein